MSLSDKVIDRLMQYVEVIKKNEQQLQVLVTTSMAATIGSRMFNNQEGSENAAGLNLGTYSESYQKQKEKKYGALLASKVNLYATGTLFGSLKTVTNNKDTYLAITDVKYKNKKKPISTVDVMGYLDKQYGEISAPQEKEEDKVLEIAQKWISKQIRDIEK